MDSNENNKLSLSSTQEELEERLLSENDADELKNIINLFNLNIKKKDILRAEKLSNLQDNVVNEMILRVEENPSLIANDVLLKYFQAIQGTIDKSDRSLNDIDVAAIQVNQNQINLNVGGVECLDTGSKLKISDAVKSILSKIDVNGMQNVVESDIDDG